MNEILTGILLATGMGALVLLFRSFYRVEEGHSAVVTNFGAIREDQGKAFIQKAGLHMKAPWQKVHEFSIMEKFLPIRDKNREVELLARDGTLLRMDPQVRFNFDANKAEAFVFGVRQPISHMRELFRSLISAEIAGFGSENSQEGSYAEIRRHRTVLQSRLQNDFRMALSDKYGVQFKAAEIAEILPPADLAQALNSVQKIEAENETLLNRFQAECAQQVAAAEHGVHIAKLNANATTIEIRTLGEMVHDLQEHGILPAYLQRRRDEVTAQSKTLYFKT